ncbi:MAG: hypothetical protein HY556_09280 [Euryarchaeota archaeon]|nr:hypothetical protein [Euryarchaeota archaeon]
MEAPVPLATAAKWSVFLELAGIIALIATAASGQPPVLEVIGTILVFFGLSIGATVWGVHAESPTRSIHGSILVTVAVLGAFIGTIGLASIIMVRSSTLPLYLAASGFGLVGLWLVLQARSPDGLGTKAGIAGTLAGIGLVIAGTTGIITYYMTSEAADTMPTPLGFVLMLLTYPIWAWNVGRVAARGRAGASGEPGVS